MDTILLAIIVLGGLLSALATLVVLANAALVIRKNVTLTINNHLRLAVTSGQKLLDYLLLNDISIPSACAGAGTCGLCKVTVLAGGGEALQTELAKLTPLEINQGVRLSCQLSVKNDLELTLPEAILTAQKQCVRVVSSRYVAPIVKEIVFETIDGSQFDFTPGDFVEITAPPFRCELNQLSIDEAYQSHWARLDVGSLLVSSDTPTSRAYSIASRPNDQGRIVLLIRLALPPPGSDKTIPPGKVSTWLFDRRVGDEVELSGPFGSFHIQSETREIVMVGGGVGLAPLRAMAHAFLQSHDKPTVHFFYGARALEDLIFANEFETLQQEYANFNWQVALSDPNLSDPTLIDQTLIDKKRNSKWKGNTGFIHTVLDREFLATHPNPDACDYYLCGPPLMMQSVKALLLDSGVGEAHIYADDFGV